MKKSKLESYMGFCSKSGNLIAGTNKVIDAMNRRKARLIIIASDISENTKEKIIHVAQKNKIQFRIYGQSEELAHYTGKFGAGGFAVTDDNFKKVISEAMDNESEKDIFRDPGENTKEIQEV